MTAYSRCSFSALQFFGSVLLLVCCSIHGFSPPAGHNKLSSCQHRFSVQDLTVAASAPNNSRQSQQQQQQQQPTRTSRTSPQQDQQRNNQKGSTVTPATSGNAAGGGAAEGGKKKWTLPPNRQLNQQIATQENALDLLALLASTKGALTNVAGGGMMNSVNFSTSIHRIARHLQYAYQNQDERSNRSRILSDPRFALLVCSAAEALEGDCISRNPTPYTDQSNINIIFGSRELSNMAWAFAKMKIAPPDRVLPVKVTEDSLDLLKEKSAEVRSMVYDVAKARSSSSEESTWIPALSELCGTMLDTISHRTKETKVPHSFQLQEWSNLLWALATAQRANEEVVTFIVTNLIKCMKANSNDEKRPQEWSNSIWALATSAIVGPEEELLPFVAAMMEDDPSFLNTFKPQELANSAWGVSTILSHQKPRLPDAASGKAALAIIRNVARQMIERNGENFKSQELSNTAWAFATIGFGLNTNGLSDNAISDYMILESDDPAEDEQLMIQAMKVIIQRTKGIHRRYQSQELNNLAWAMARLRQPDAELFEMIGVELCNRQRAVTAQDIGTTLWAFASAEYFNQDSYRGPATRLTTIKKQLKPQELSNTLWALATAEVIPRSIDVFDTSLLPSSLRPSPSQIQNDPITVCYAMGAQELMTRPSEFKSQEIKDVLWSFSKVPSCLNIIESTKKEFLPLGSHFVRLLLFTGII
jgi:hypothetical protein